MQRDKGKITRLESIVLLLNITRYIIILTGIISLIAFIYLAFQPQSNFEATKHYMDWDITGHLINTSSITVTIPNRIMNCWDDVLTYNAKYVFFLYTLINSGVRFFFIFSSIQILRNLAIETLDGKSPFSTTHIRGLKLISLYLFIYYGVIDLFINVLFNIFINKRFSIALDNIHISGLFIGLIVYLIVLIFEYGKSLQEDSNSII